MTSEMDGVHPYPVSVPNPAAKSRRRAAAKVASHTRWATEPDRVAATAPARAGLLRKFEDQVDPGRVLEPTERARRVENAKSAHFTRLAQMSAESRAAAKKSA